MRAMINRTRVEGYIYESKLELRVSGAQSKNPNTEYITGTLSVATDEACLNVVPVHFTYVTALTSKGTPNATFNTLKTIVDGKAGTVISDGKDKASKVRIDSAIGLNEFYTDRNGKEELVTAKRNEGGFVHFADTIDPDEKNRNTFECDMIINKVTRVEANEEKKLPEKVIVKGAIFDFRNNLLPVEFSAKNERAMDYFESLEASQKSPVFTKIRGRQISETIVNTIQEESAFGDTYVREVKNNRKDFVITWAASEPYVWDDESTITVTELNEAIAKREIALAELKQKSDEFKNKNKSVGVMAAITNANGPVFNF